MKNKVKLNTLKVQSFQTSFNNNNVQTIKGGSFSAIGSIVEVSDLCPSVNVCPTISATSSIYINPSISVSG